MGMSDCFAYMNEVHVRTTTARKEQLAIRLWHTNGGLNSCHRQPRLRFIEAEGKSNAEWWQYKEDQFKAMRDQIEGLIIRIFNLCSHKGSGFRNPFAKHRTYGR